ncbi:two-component system response regulator [Paenibacillus sp.]|uniref:two-component system response regulator n=1 Tax=Paenibacillus sp. TaxID=58172 RepID=UPI002D48E52D|nr:EAL domain-containing protein [Paenibacillus sp.]HZG86113.1 EAL domain-containing protein [Paenibacillus sp.]
MSAAVSERINILVVDDRPENLVALEALLSSKYVNLVKCDSGEAALRYLLKEDCALILLDVQMPGMDGYETAQLIKTRERCKDIPIIFITAINKDPEHVHYGYALGAIDYIFKPFDPDTLKAKVDSLLEMHLSSQRLVEQTRLLNEKTKELEQANARLLRLAADLQRAEAMAKVIGETSSDTMITFDEEGVITSVNPAVTRMFGYAREEVLGGSIDRLFREPFLRRYVRSGETPWPNEDTLELEAIDRGGALFPAEVQLHETRLEQRRIYACTIRDATERKAQLEQLEYMALHDMLTGLPNRIHLHEAVRRRRGEPFALIMFDLDHFKTINDTLGHSYGDELLKCLSRELLALVPADGVVARMGGDEFAVLLPNSGAAEAERAVQSMIQIIEQPVSVDGITLAVGVSMGIALSPTHGDDPETLLRCADVAMYSAKTSSVGYAVYDKSADGNSPYRLSLMGDLRSAVEKGQFRLHYQPKLRIGSRSVAGVEALLRWEHPEHGFVPPCDFIPLVEQTGFIHTLTLWVLEEAIRQCKAWEDAGIDLPVAVNLSVRCLQHQQFPQLASGLLRKYRLPEHKLQLEITESFLMADTARATIVLEQLHRSGIRLAIDDFGTGFSSLAYLKQLPVSQVKIDKSFVMSMQKDDSSAMIVRSIIQLAHNLRMGVVAEGVECAEAWETLSGWGCDEAQGFYIAKPLPADAFEAWLRDECDDARWTKGGDGA